MFRCVLVLVLITVVVLFGATDANGYDLKRLPPVAAPADIEAVDSDWLVDPIERKAGVFVSEDRMEIVMANGLISRAWRIEPDAACVAFDNLMTGASVLRAVRPEARVEINGQSHDIGGLIGQPDHAYLTEEWLDRMEAAPGAFEFTGFEEGEPKERFPWKRVRHHAPGAEWPPPGVSLRLDFEGTGPELSGVRVSVHYEMYHGLPVMQKWITVHNGTDQPIDVDSFTCEILAVVEHCNPVENREEVPLPHPDSPHVETDYAFGAFRVYTARRFSVHWLPDPLFKSQVNWERMMPCLLEVKPETGPDQTVEPGETFESFRAYELLYDSWDRVRQGLALRRMYRAVAPWITENPLILHVVSTDEKVVKQAVDQAAECGFEMVSLSFGSGLSMENESAANLDKFKGLADYAASRGIHLGGYSLLSSRRIAPASDNIVNPETGKPGGQTHGFCPALASGWGQNYFRKLYGFFEATGFLQFTHDGSYPGDLDAAARPPLQKGVNDSRWVQWKIITDYYKWLRGRGVYLRVPDYYYLSGSNECGMGYREVNWSLPRALQVIHTRQNIYDGTWQKTPSMGWMFVPLTQYHGGGAAATIEPLDEHLDHYGLMMASNLGAGVQAVFRGHRLYDTDRTRELVKRWVGWYKSYRNILESDIIHASSRRADGRGLDWLFHANPNLKEKGMLVVYNPLNRKVNKTIRLGLYYTGLDTGARISERGEKYKTYPIDRRFSVSLPVEVEARGVTWFVIEKT